MWHEIITKTVSDVLYDAGLLGLLWLRNSRLGCLLTYYFYLCPLIESQFQPHFHLRVLSRVKFSVISPIVVNGSWY